MRRRRSGLRRWVAAGAAAASVAAALGVLAPDPAAGRVPVLVATRDVPAGAALTAGDVRRVLRPATDVPATVADAAAAGDVDGRVLAGPLGAGEVVTTTRLVGASLLAGRPPDDVAAPVRLADPQVAALLRTGQRVDVLAAVEGGPSARVVARGATVLAAPGAGAGGPAGGGGLLGDGGDDAAEGGLVVLAVGTSTAADLAQAAAQGVLTVVMR